MGIFKKLIKGTIDIAVLPVAIIKDVATMGGTLTDEDTTYTGKQIRRIDKTAKQIYNELDD